MKRWYLLYCKRGEQPRAKLHLENQGVECYYPEVVVEKIVRNKRQEVTEPLFPSYVFVNFDYEVGPSFTSVRSTRGVVDFIRFGPLPKEINSTLISELKMLEQNDLHVQNTLPEKGQILEITGGQFAGIDAIYQEPDGETRSILLVKMINQNVEISVDNKNLAMGG
ncbi:MULTISPECIES: transcription/translation regulatory transformer protein RfaH [Vibrio]|uniref:Transcription antitermination protein RfaH n=2 Tax=Vibrio TaxID=662 RepID=A0A7X4RUL6_9VIBR|nr:MULTISPECIES: transcription/translation regulatory transformer protein RfaH [Vibrio]MBF8999818.1 transcription/translation regulatory transformer protein RfaH [Vibrio nitrifigilis]MZI93400.1 transcription/translation regulatory transformer protein RfaH [Vibrio eleionomae]